MAASAAKPKFVLVIDAGHGGHDAGAIGAISKEKDLTLRYALAFGAMVERNCPDVKVIYTRKKDVFLELWQRAEIANKNKADLFISVHINSLPKGRIARGYQTYTLGKGRSGVGIIKNLDVAKRENAVILLEDNYQQTYQGYDPNSPESDIMFEFIQDKNMERSVELARFMQRHVCAATGRQDMGAHQENLAVLRLSSMPGCLLELGFISTPDEEQFMNSEAALDKYARGIFNAFVAYKNKYNYGITVPFQPDPEPEIEVPSIVPPESQPVKPVKPTPPRHKPDEPKPTPAAPATPVDTARVDTVPAVSVQPVATTTPDATTPAVSEDAVFKVQIVATSTKLKPGDPKLKGRTDVDFYSDGGMFKYTVGSSTDYQQIYQLRKDLAADFSEAFIIAFKNGQRCDVQQAIREYKLKKNKKK